MSWSAQIQSKNRNKDKLDLILLFIDSTDANNNFTKPFTVESAGDSIELLKQRVKNQLDTLNSLDTFPVNVGAFDATPAAPIPPTQQEIDFNNFQRWMQVMVALNAAKQMGVITGTEPIVVTAINNIKALATINLPKLFS